MEIQFLDLPKNIPAKIAKLSVLGIVLIDPSLPSTSHTDYTSSVEFQGFDPLNQHCDTSHFTYTKPQVYQGLKPVRAQVFKYVQFVTL